jgi:cysteine desulfurase
VLFIGSPLQPDPILFGGGHENERRAGTENLAAIAGCVAALDRFVCPPVFEASYMTSLLLPIKELLRAMPDCSIVSPTTMALANTLSFTVGRSDGLTLLANLDLAGFCASSGSACSAGSLNPSHVLRAMGNSPLASAALLRFSVGRQSVPSDISALVARLPEIIRCSQLPS